MAGECERRTPSAAPLPPGSQANRASTEHDMRTVHASIASPAAPRDRDPPSRTTDGAGRLEARLRACRPLRERVLPTTDRGESGRATRAGVA
jgi:hypothetical protein